MTNHRQCDVVVAGAINTDLVAVVDRAPEAGETVTGLDFAVYGGGKAANQAVAALRSGATVALVGAVGDDAFGADRRQELEREGIDLDGVTQNDGKTSGVALITVETHGENRIAYVPGPTLSITGDQIGRVLSQVRPAIYLQPNEAPLEATRRALTRAKSSGALTVVNAAPDPELLLPHLAEIDILIVNQGEAEALAKTPGSPEGLVAILAAQVAGAVALTAGGDGVYLQHGDSVNHLGAPPVEVVDTTGAGDTFCGALAARLARGDDLEAAARWAVVAASLATTRAGAQPSIPTGAEVDAYIAGARAE